MPRQSAKASATPSPKAMAAILEESGIRPTAAQLERLWTYHQWLRKHNEELNLTRIHNFENMVRKLYVDSLLPGIMIPLPSPLMDLGTGPGMPGIPLKIFHPHLHLVLAESRQHRVRFLESVCEALGLEQVVVEGRRIGPHYDRAVHGVITRAVEPMAETLERIEGCLEKGGRVIFMKGPQCDEELERAVRLFAGRYAVVEDRAYVIPGTPHRRRLVVFVRESERPAVVRQRAGVGGRHKVLASRENAEFKRLFRALTPKGIKKEGVCLVSGSKLVADVLRSRSDLVQAWITVQGGPPPPPASPESVVWLELDKALFEVLDVFGTGRPLLCVRVPPCPPWSPEDGLEPGCTLFVPFQDPENVGAVLRTAAAFGVTAVVLLKEAAHPFHPKAVRASAGAVFRLRLRLGPSLHDLPATLPLVALSQDGRPLEEVVFPDSFGLLAGLEGLGVPAIWRKKAAAIPMAPGTESLNAATATAVALYEWRRRTTAPKASSEPAR
uniref:Ribosomal RNA small subunit methyltransferase G n=1 Tax=Desulfacinum infernum TaxID=35837 RepID=A0A832A8U7_9BACT